LESRSDALQLGNALREAPLRQTYCKSRGLFREGEAPAEPQLSNGSAM
jgi:hypothetical protein